MRGLAVFAFCISLTLLSTYPASGQADGEAVEVKVLFDFGDGTVLWQEVSLSDNRTAILATERAANLLGLSIEVQWFSFGAFVADIGNRNPVWPLWWHFLQWNGVASEWELATVGASDVQLQGAETLGWFLAEDDPPWPGTKPLASPTHPYPVTTFRGDLVNSGVTTSTAPVRPGLAWSFDFEGDEIAASPVAVNGVVYQVTWNGTHAVDMESRQILWRTPEVAGLSTPAIVAGDLVVGSRDGRLYRLEGGTGEVVWSTLLQGGAQFTGIASSPKLHDGRAYVGTFNESGGPGHLYAVNVTGGAVIWSLETGSIHMSSPAVSGGAVYVGVMGLFDPSSLTWERPYGLLSVSEDEGEERWFFEAEGPVASSPSVEDGLVYFTSQDGNLYAVGVDGSLTFEEEIGASTSSPAVRGDFIYAASGILGAEGRVVAFEKAVGRLWEFTPNGPIQGSVTLAADLVLVATNAEEGTLYALRARDGSMAWSFTPEPPQHILATPVVVDGLVLIPSDNGLLYALGEAPEGPTLNPILIYAVIVGAAAFLVVVGTVLVLRRRRGP